MKEALKYLQAGAIVPVDMETTILLVNALKEALAQRPWVDLTKEEKQECVNQSIYHTAWSSDVDLDTLINLIQQKLKDKNENR